VMNDLQVEVRDGDIRIAKRGTPFAVTYRKNSVSPILEAHEILEGPEISSDEAIFLAAAWNAAFKKAKALGWL